MRVGNPFRSKEFKSSDRFLNTSCASSARSTETVLTGFKNTAFCVEQINVICTYVTYSWHFFICIDNRLWQEGAPFELCFKVNGDLAQISSKHSNLISNIKLKKYFTISQYIIANNYLH